jgi:hypothetical protein
MFFILANVLHPVTVRVPCTDSTSKQPITVTAQAVSDELKSKNDLTL